MVSMPAMILAAESNSLKLNSDRVLALDRSVILLDDVVQVLRLAQLDGQAVPLDDAFEEAAHCGQISRSHEQEALYVSHAKILVSSCTEHVVTSSASLYGTRSFV
jgi:hypothetical protein